MKKGIFIFIYQIELIYLRGKLTWDLEVYDIINKAHSFSENSDN